MSTFSSLSTATALSQIPKMVPPGGNTILNVRPGSPHFCLKFKFNTNRSLFTLFTSSCKPQLRCKSRPRTSIQCLFTGIVEEMGRVKNLGVTENGGFDLEIVAKTVLEGVHLGDSIAVNGTCLTVTAFDHELSEFTVGLAPETLRKTSLVELVPGSPVNLERAVQPISRMGGHFVQGHVDGTGEIISMEPEEDSLWIKVRTSEDLLKYIVPKGFIAVDGTSLTVVDVFDEEKAFNFMLVAYTQNSVVIPLKKVGDLVNLEVDILGKYVQRLLSNGAITPIKSP
ncbi:LOW QUALITY PROTEIN: riboflavin synthase [Momordica charantia]|uniref:Riboflavin synthase n=1 Tax=Momordica charantia TaxID=3673 RepID=L0C7R1_MOMCH|nr:LOW QUALITY PROTEIN: riboflavin synthase [Momordica charantia]AFZ99647.1 riboflavin synthase [Momordica charantia]